MSSDYKRVRDYELMVVFHPELSEEDLISEVSRVESHLTGGDGTIRLINRELPWGRRRLAYPIRHGSRDVRDGIYVLYYFTTESTRIEEIEREIKLDDRILRYLLTQQSAPMMEPTPAEEEGAEQAEAGAAPQSETAAPGDTPTAEPVAAEGEVAAAAAGTETPEAPAEESKDVEAPPADAPEALDVPAADTAAAAETPITNDVPAEEETAKSAEAVATDVE